MRRRFAFFWKGRKHLMYFKCAKIRIKMYENLQGKNTFYLLQLQFFEIKNLLCLHIIVDIRICGLLSFVGRYCKHRGRSNPTESTQWAFENIEYVEEECVIKIFIKWFLKWLERFQSWKRKRAETSDLDRWKSWVSDFFNQSSTENWPMFQIKKQKKISENDRATTNRTQLQNKNILNVFPYFLFFEVRNQKYNIIFDQNLANRKSNLYGLIHTSYQRYRKHTEWIWRRSFFVGKATLLLSPFCIVYKHFSDENPINKK